MERLFIAYFENGEDIGDIRVLADIADLCGMDGVEVAEMLESDTDLALVEREDQIAHEMGVTGVPAMIFGNKLAVSGAREPEVLAMVIDKVAELAGTVAGENLSPDSGDASHRRSAASATSSARGATSGRQMSSDAARLKHRRMGATKSQAASATTLLRPVRLGPVQRLIGAMQQRVGGVVLAFRAGDADGDGDVERVRARG